MAVIRIKVEDYQVFKGKFECDFCTGVNVIIGGERDGEDDVA